MMAPGGAGAIIRVVRTQTRGPETVVTSGDRDTQVRALAPGADMVTAPGLSHRVIGHQVMEAGGPSDQLPGVSGVFV